MTMEIAEKSQMSMEHFKFIVLETNLRPHQISSIMKCIDILCARFLLNKLFLFHNLSLAPIENFFINFLVFFVNSNIRPKICRIV